MTEDQRIEAACAAMRAKRVELQHAPLDRIYGDLFAAAITAYLAGDVVVAATLIEEQRREIERRDDFQPLLDAYIAATYCLNRYRHLHAGRSVRDLDEAEERLRICATKLDAWASLAPPPRTESAGCDSGKVGGAV